MGVDWWDSLGEKISRQNNHNNVGSLFSGIASAGSAYFETEEGVEVLCLYRWNAFRLDCTTVLDLAMNARMMRP